MAMVRCMASGGVDVHRLIELFIRASGSVSVEDTHRRAIKSMLHAQQFAEQFDLPLPNAKATRDATFKFVRTLWKQHEQCSADSLIIEHMRDLLVANGIAYIDQISYVLVYPSVYTQQEAENEMPQCGYMKLTAARAGVIPPEFTHGGERDLSRQIQLTPIEDLMLSMQVRSSINEVVYTPGAGYQVNKFLNDGGTIGLQAELIKPFPLANLELSAYLTFKLSHESAQLQVKTPKFTRSFPYFASHSHVVIGFFFVQEDDRREAQGELIEEH